jgi:hypothetical protein
MRQTARAEKEKTRKAQQSASEPLAPPAPLQPVADASDRDDRDLALSFDLHPHSPREEDSTPQLV